MPASKRRPASFHGPEYFVVVDLNGAACERWRAKLFVQRQVATGYRRFPAGRRLFAPRKTARSIVEMLRASYDKLANDKQFMSDLRNVGGEDAEMISAAKIQPLVKQLLVISPGVRDFTKKITAKHLQR